jgi:hypothetical protein
MTPWGDRDELETVRTEKFVEVVYKPTCTTLFRQPIAADHHQLEQNVAELDKWLKWYDSVHWAMEGYEVYERGDTPRGD